MYGSPSQAAIGIKFPAGPSCFEARLRRGQAVTNFGEKTASDWLIQRLSCGK